MAADATQKQIEAAYRRAATRCHPDRHDGDTTAIKALNDAYEVLGDPDRRKRYDETGQTDGPQSTVVATLVSMFHEVLQTIVSTGIDPEHADLMKLLAAKIETLKKTGIAKAKEARDNAAKMRKIAGRFDDPGSNVLAGSLLSNAATMEAHAVQIDTEIASLAECESLLRSYRYKFDGGPGPMPSWLKTVHSSTADTGRWTASSRYGDS